jgi:hypothetical protein
MIKLLEGEANYFYGELCLNTFLERGFVYEAFDSLPDPINQEYRSGFLLNQLRRVVLGGGGATRRFFPGRRWSRRGSEDVKRIQSSQINRLNTG